MPADTDDDSLRVWEAEVMVHAAAWVLIWRGTGLAVGIALSFAALFPLPGVMPSYWVWPVVPAVILAVAGLAILCREQRALWFAVPVVVGWVFVVTSPLVTANTDPRSRWDAFGIARSTLLQAMLPAFFLPDVLALWCLLRREGRETLAEGQPALPPILTAWRVHASGRVLVAMGMATLAFLSAAACIVGLPGLMIT